MEGAAARWTRRALLNGVALLLLLATAEAALRVAARPGDPRTSTAPGGRYRALSDPRGPLEVIEYDHWIVNNRFGFHSPDHPVRPGPGRSRVAFFGDSMVQADQVAVEEAFPARIETLLPRVEALAFGRNGHHLLRLGGVVAEARGRLRDAAGEAPPDVAVVVLHGPYSVRQAVEERCLPPWKEGMAAILEAYRGPGWILHRLRNSAAGMLREPTDSMQAAMAGVLGSGAAPDLEARAWRLVEEGLAGVQRDLAAWGARPAYAYLPERGELAPPAPGADTDRVRRRFEAVVGATGAPWIDLTPGMREAASAGAPLHFEFDGHLTAEGHRVAAGLLAPALEGLLGR